MLVFDLSQYRCSDIREIKSTCIEIRSPCLPFSTHVKMLHEVSKALWRLCLCYKIQDTIYL